MLFHFAVLGVNNMLHVYLFVVRNISSVKYSSLKVIDEYFFATESSQFTARKDVWAIYFIMARAEHRRCVNRTGPGAVCIGSLLLPDCDEFSLASYTLIRARA